MNDKKIRKDIESYAAGLGVKTAVKETSFLMRAINILIGFFNPGFMVDYITTIGGTVYFPERMLKEDGTVWSVLPHETQHGVQFNKMSVPVAALVYLFPQWLSLLSLLSLGAIWGGLWWLLWLTNLLWLAPWPAPGRKWMEMQGYALSLLVKYEQYRAIGREDAIGVPPYMVRQFTGSFYYFMWPFKARVEAELGDWITKIKDGRIDKELPIAADIRRIIRENSEED